MLTATAQDVQSRIAFKVFGEGDHDLSQIFHVGRMREKQKGELAVAVVLLGDNRSFNDGWVYVDWPVPPPTPRKHKHSLHPLNGGIGIALALCSAQQMSQCESWLQGTIYSGVCF